MHSNTHDMLSTYLFSLGAHIGHLRVEEYQSSSHYMIGTRSLFNVIDLRKTIPMLKSALLFVERVIHNFGHALFCHAGLINIGMHIRAYFTEIVTSRNQSFSHWRWAAGCITNYRTVFLRLVKYMYRNASAKRARNKRRFITNIITHTMLNRHILQHMIHCMPEHSMRRKMIYLMTKYKNTVLYKERVRLAKALTGSNIVDVDDFLLKPRLRYGLRLPQFNKIRNSLCHRVQVGKITAKGRIKEHAQRIDNNKMFSNPYSPMLYGKASTKERIVKKPTPCILTRRIGRFLNRNALKNRMSIWSYIRNIITRLSGYTRRIGNADSIAIQDNSGSKYWYKHTKGWVTKYKVLLKKHKHDASKKVTVINNKKRTHEKELDTAVKTEVVRQLAQYRPFVSKDLYKMYKYVLCVHNIRNPHDQYEVAPGAKPLFSWTPKVLKPFMVYNEKLGKNLVSPKILSFFMRDSELNLPGLQKYQFRKRLRNRLLEIVKTLSIKQISIFRTLPSFISMLVRIFYITNTKLAEFVSYKENVDEDVYFHSVYRRFRLFWRAIIFFKCFKKTANIPDCLVLINPHNSKSQMNDFTGVNLPIIAITDTNSDIFRITYPIPSNDDSIVLSLSYISIFLNSCDTGTMHRYALYSDDVYI